VAQRLGTGGSKKDGYLEAEVGRRMPIAAEEWWFHLRGTLKAVAQVFYPSWLPTE